MKNTPEAASSSVRAPTNIAFIKYWGKHPKYEELMVPTKSSASFTVEGLYAQTSMRMEKGHGVDFSLNGKKIAPEGKEMQYVNEFFNRIFSHYPQAAKWHYSIESANNFPTAAGFASSAAGFAALAVCFSQCMQKLGKMPKLDERELSVLARLGSGSATRSVPEKGGLVVWHRGFDKAKTPQEASDASFAETILPPPHFSELSIIYCKVEEGEKKTKSRAGMRQSVGTVHDYYGWAEFEEKMLLPHSLLAAKEKDWVELFKICKKASSNFHAICQRTYPPIHYLNDKSWEIIDAIQPMEEAAYTFDAGPNAVIFTLKGKEKETVRLLEETLGKGKTVVTKVGAGPKVMG